ncbi:MAG TPA: aminotransferase class III-fold pyridoxal phosphate-dependent enzyme [Chloroflexota bacterium]|nr:aminotransferase class III-fold pyridoxal phosphate-dependent enzyme [Chloroflexota bacterium]
MATEARQMTIDQEMYERMAGSSALYERAKETFPSGVTHDARYAKPFPIYVNRAQGSRKWDVDGNEYVDYYGGHGALILGHCHPAITDAVVKQAQTGTHYAAGHELEVRWGELVQEIVPSAEAVKFVSSGTEATMLAIRLARAFTGRDRVIKVNTHFHGWHDYAVVAMAPPFDVPISIGVPKGVQDTVTGIDDKDADALEAELAKGDVAAVIIWCNALTKEWAETVRDKAKAHGALVIYDEVVTGFRYAPGGAQEYFGVTPDLTTLAKIVAGGLPGGAIAGRADVIHQFDFSDDPRKQRFGRIAHPGTYNGNPLSAAAGVACLEIVRDPAIQKKAADTATKIKAGFQDALTRNGVEGSVGGWMSYITTALKAKSGTAWDLQLKWRAAMQLAGVDPSGTSLIVSAVHDDEDVARTVAAYESAIHRLQAEGLV